ncbi:MAG: phosphoribosyltransferase [Gemmatimonadota bacterium]|nr:phosphoribosyltransferase [Gemmatimonadota bacterium]
MPRQFTDRARAGQALAKKLEHLRGRNLLVLGLPRGGLPVAYEVAHALGAPLDLLNVRKLGVPWHEELAMGAIGAGGVRVLNNDVVMSMGITKAVIEETAAVQQAELDRRERVYRNGRAAPAIRGRTVVLVDDGIATGATVRAAIAVVRAHEPAAIILAVPVVQQTVAAELRPDVDELVAVVTPADLIAIGTWYDHFEQLTDSEVQRLLALSGAARDGVARADATTASHAGDYVATQRQ